VLRVIESAWKKVRPAPNSNSKYPTC